MVKRSAQAGLLIAVLAAAVAFGAVDREYEYSEREWQRVFDEFGLEVADVVPAGVIPLEVTSPGQLRKLLSGSRNGAIELSVSAPDLQEMSLLTAGETLGITETYVDLHAIDRHELIVIFHLEARVWIVGGGSFWEITDCNEHVYFTGWCLFWGHEGEWCEHHIASDRQSVQVRGGAIFYGYLGIPDIGEVRLYEYRYNLAINYSL